MAPELLRLACDVHLCRIKIQIGFFFLFFLFESETVNSFSIRKLF